jgi:DNA repair exonuclease SbcCD ATPase subunit
MRLHSIEIDNWRQHARLMIEFGEAATIIYGPNETGKSTVLEALGRGLFDRSSSHSEAIKHIKPLTARGNVTSTVRIEFTLMGTKYRVEKNFNWRIGTRLYRLSGEKAVLLDQDDSADEQLIRLLEANLPSSRGSKPSQWGAFQWLWAAQDNRELPTGNEGDPTLSLHLETTQSGGVLVTPALFYVQKSLEPLYGRYFTDTGRLSSNSPVSDLEKEIQILQVKKTQLSETMGRVEDMKRQLRDLQDQLPGLEAKVRESRKELEEARSEATDFSAVEAELKAGEGEVLNAKRDVEDAEKAVGDLKKSSDKIVELEAGEKDTRQNYSSLEARCELLEKRQQDAKAEVERKAIEVRESEELVRDARILWTMFETAEKLKTISKTVSKINAIDEKIAALREKTLLLVPTNKELETLKQSQTKIEVLKENLQSGGLTVSIVPGERGTLSVNIDGDSIEEGTLNAVGTETVTVEAPRLGRAIITANLKQMRDAKTAIARLENAIQTGLNKYSVASVKELGEVIRTQDEIARKVKLLLAERGGIDERPLREIELEFKKLQEKSDGFNSIKRTSNAVRLNPTDADLGELVKKREREETRVRLALDKARDARDELDGQILEEKQKLAELRTRQTHLSDELTSARTREREIIGLYGSISHQENKLVAAKANLEKKKKECEGIRQRYEDLEKGPMNRIKRLGKEVSNGEELVQEQLGVVNQLTGAIRMSSLDGAYSDLAETDSRIEILDERLQKERIFADAYKLLKGTLEQQYHSALLTVVGPIKHEVERSLRYVTGDLHEDVDLNKYLSPTRVSERGLDNVSLEFSDGSSGLREILALCVRLAIAEHLSKRDSQCLALDDPFVHVSSDRSNRMVELINKTIEECGLQVIIFTHRPSEFAGFSGKLVDIQNLAAAT